MKCIYTSTALMCPQLSNPPNGVVSFYTLEIDFPPFELDTTATYMCNSGYGLTPSGVDPIRLCESDDDSLNGVWTGQTLFCSGDEHELGSLLFRYFSM